MNDPVSKKGSPPDREPGALRIVLIYLVTGGLWIVFSDNIASALVHDKAMLTTVSTLKEDPRFLTHGAILGIFGGAGTVAGWIGLTLAARDMLFSEWQKLEKRLRSLARDDDGVVLPDRQRPQHVPAVRTDHRSARIAASPGRGNLVSLQRRKQLNGLRRNRQSHPAK